MMKTHSPHTPVEADNDAKREKDRNTLVCFLQRVIPTRLQVLLPRNPRIPASWRRHLTSRAPPPSAERWHPGEEEEEEEAKEEQEGGRRVS